MNPPSSVAAPDTSIGPMASSKHLPALDGVRGLAVLIVFVFHYGGGTHSSFGPMRIFGLVNKGGWSGVVLFFVLSGFLITGILWDGYSDPQWWRKFFARRSLRIFPLYYLALLAVLLAAIPGGTFSAACRSIWIPLLFLEDMPRLAYVAGNIPSPLPIFHLWSIAVEEQFYLLWPAILFWCWRTSVRRDHRVLARNVCLAVFLGSLLFRFLIWRYYPAPPYFEHFLITQAGALAAGAWLALAYRGPEWPRVVRAAPAVACAGLLGFVATGLLEHDFEAIGLPMMTLGLLSVTLLYAGLLALTVGPGLAARFFSMAWLRWLGNISYGAYVFHVLLMPLFQLVTRHLAAGRGLMLTNLVQFVVAATLSLAAAMLSFHLYEKQFLRLKKYFVPAPRKAAAAQTR